MFETVEELTAAVSSGQGKLVHTHTITYKPPICLTVSALGIYKGLSNSIGEMLFFQSITITPLQKKDAKKKKIQIYLKAFCVPEL